MLSPFPSGTYPTARSGDPNVPEETLGMINSGQARKAECYDLELDNDVAAAAPETTKMLWRMWYLVGDLPDSHTKRQMAEVMTQMNYAMWLDSLPKRTETFLPHVLLPVDAPCAVATEVDLVRGSDHLLAAAPSQCLALLHALLNRIQLTDPLPLLR